MVLLAKVAVQFDASTVLLMAATALFILATISKVARGWMVPIGLACFAAAFWLEVLIS